MNYTTASATCKYCNHEMWPDGEFIERRQDGKLVDKEILQCLHCGAERRNGTWLTPLFAVPDTD